MASSERIAVVGAGYVGLPLALLLAKAGRDVLVIDTDRDKVTAIADGTWHVDEGDLQSLLVDPDVRSHLRATTVAEGADVFVIAVPTPTDKRKKLADLTSLEAALHSMVPVLQRGNLVIVESTIPPLTTRDVVTPILETSGLNVGTDLLVAHCPERVLPGNTLFEMIHNDRLIGDRRPRRPMRRHSSIGSSSTARC